MVAFCVARLYNSSLRYGRVLRCALQCCSSKTRYPKSQKQHPENPVGQLGQLGQFKSEPCKSKSYQSPIIALRSVHLKKVSIVALQKIKRYGSICANI